MPGALSASDVVLSFQKGREREGTSQGRGKKPGDTEGKTIGWNVEKKVGGKNYTASRVSQEEHIQTTSQVGGSLKKKSKGRERIHVKGRGG